MAAVRAVMESCRRVRAMASEADVDGVTEVVVAAVMVISLDLVGVGESLSLEVGVIKVEAAMVWKERGKKRERG